MGRLIASVVVYLAVVLGAVAQPYPSRPVTLIVPYPAGGPTDALARIVAEHMHKVLGQTIVIENVGGAGGTVGSARVARATPNGYTICIGQTSSHVFSGAVYTLNYDLVRDFEPISLLASSPQWMLARVGFPGKNLQDAIAWLKANPGKASFGTSGNGSLAHVWGLNFARAIDAPLGFVAYRGGGPLLQDLVAGHIDLAVLDASFSLPQVNSGSARALAVLEAARWRKSPDTPTVDESGMTGQHLPYWHGLWAPRGTPGEVIARLDAAVVETLGDPTTRQRLDDMGMEVFPRDQLSPAALAATQKADIDKWWPIIKAAQIKPD